MAEIGSDLSTGRWLATSNPFMGSSSSVLAEARNFDHEPRQRDLARYVGASSPVHVLDGWKYLGHALYAILNGTIDSAKHLGHYAELRAAMALLASQGIGIFNNTNVVVDEDGLAQRMPRDRGTHQAAWLYLDCWASYPEAADLVGGILQLANGTIAEWFQNVRHLGAWTPVGADLLRKIGLDLKHMTSDRYARNEASYRPSEFTGVDTQTASDDAGFVEMLLRTLEIELHSRPFQNLDRYLCRTILEGTQQQFLRDHNTLPDASIETVTSYEESLNAFTDSASTAAILRRFLERADGQQDPGILRNALSDDNHHQPEYTYGLVSRALLLLRLATGAVQQLIAESGISAESLDSWSSAVMHTYGLWNDSHGNITNLSELWVDIEIGLDSLGEWREEGNTSRRDMLSRCSAAIVDVTGTARFGLMGLCR